MKKQLFFSAAMMVAVGFAAVGCSSNNDVEFNPNAGKEFTYNEAFVKQFGKIDPKNNWGFGASTKSIGTRSANTNAHQWGTYVEVPAALTQAQKDVVTQWFKNNKNPQGIAVQWSDFFAQQVSSGEYSNQMNKLTCGTSNDHINNFNSGTCSTNNVYNGVSYHPDQIQFMVNSSTDCFGFHNSGDNTQYNDNYVIIPGSKIDASVAGMYFVGFDYENHMNQEVNKDGYYDNWIIKITPALYKGNNARRIMCEDLGATDDFDFNDVVFDVYNEWGSAVITLHAAGGTLPITVAGKDVHEAFGTKEMVNTGKGATCPVVIFRVSQNYYDFKVPVVVSGSNGATWTLNAETGEAPQMFAVPTSVKWATERTNIKDAYPQFINYVGDANTYSKWYESPAGGLW